MARHWGPYLVCIVVLLLLLPPKTRRHRNENGHPDIQEVGCAILLDGFRSSDVNFSTGFNYELLKRTAKLLGCDFHIRLSHDKAAALDSLEDGYLDLLVLPCGDSSLIERKDLFYCPILEDSTVWVMRKEGELPEETVNSGLSHIRLQKYYSNLIDRFSPHYEPFSRLASGRRFSVASPYDSLFKVYAAELGWDWRYLASVIWQESRFRIEARSGRGAAGLMQMKAATSTSHGGSEDRLDPETSLKAATNYLLRLRKLFEKEAENEEELDRFTLAAYNGGEGRLMESFKQADSAGRAHSKWEYIKEFCSRETEKYLEITDSLYQVFKIIVP